VLKIFTEKLMKKNNCIIFLNLLSTVLLRGISSPIFSRLLGTGGYGIVNTFSTCVGIFIILHGLSSTIDRRF